MPDKPEWAHVRNVRTGSSASALEITEEMLLLAGKFFAFTRVKPGWWLLVYQDHSARVFNPENFKKTYYPI